MEKYNTENLIFTLFALGFEQIDSIFLTVIVGKISTEQIELQQFKYEEKAFTKQFEGLVDFDGLVYKLKDGLTLESDTKLFKDKVYTINELFIAGVVNKKLLRYFTNFDFRDIIIHKINLIGLDRIGQLSCLFSDKEKNIMYDMFGIEDMHRQESSKSLQAYEKIYNQENDDIDNAIRTLSKMKSK